MTITRSHIFRLALGVPLALAVLLLGAAGHGTVRGAPVAGTGSGGGTILFSRHNHWYTIAPNGTHLHMILSSTAGCPDFGCASFSPQGTRIMVAAHAPDKKRITTAILNTDGSGYHALPLPDRTLNLGSGVWAPNGTRIALQGWDTSKKGRNGIYAVNASDGKDLVRLTTSPDAFSDDPLAYSPDGSRLLFSHEGPSHDPAFGDLFETNANGSSRVKLNPPGRQVPVGHDFGSPGSWSPNGRQITFTAFTAPPDAGQSAVFVIGANGSHRRRVTEWGQRSTGAHWSPGGQWIESDKVQPGTGLHNLFVVHPNGTGFKTITSISLGGACCAVWSPDGKKLLFQGGIGGKNLWIVNRDGSGLTQLASNPAGYAAYSWGR